MEEGDYEDGVRSKTKAFKNLSSKIPSLWSLARCQLGKFQKNWLHLKILLIPSLKRFLDGVDQHGQTESLWFKGLL
jgi:hypothetical protein